MDFFNDTTHAIASSIYGASDARAHSGDLPDYLPRLKRRWVATGSGRTLWVHVGPFADGLVTTDEVHTPRIACWCIRSASWSMTHG